MMYLSLMGPTSSSTIQQAIGGVIYAAFSTSSSFHGTSSFSTNSAMQGGATYVEHDSKLTFIGRLALLTM